MTRLISICLLILFWAGGVAAQNKLLVRSAEHPDYSRLIVPVDQNTDWFMAQDGRLTKVTFAGMRSQFLLDDVFARMPRTRIVGVVSRLEPLGSALELTLNCSCDVSTTRIGSRFVAIDVRRSESKPAEKSAKHLLNPHTNSANGEAGEEKVGPASQVSDAGPNGSEKSAVNAELGHADQPLEQTEKKDVYADNMIEHGDSDMAEELLDHQPRGPLETVRKDLRMQLSNAAMEGLLEFAERPEAEDFADQINMLDADAMQREMPNEEGLAGGALLDLLENKQINTRSALDLEDRQRAGLDNKITCTSDVALNVARWTDGKPLIDELGELRKEIVTEYGKVNKRAVIDLARLYILNGFGREAIAVLELSPEEIRDGDLLKELAMVVEGRALPESSILAMSGECEGRISLWRTVAGLELLDQESERGATILKAFSELPPELRRIAGDKIAGQSLESGDSAAAGTVIGILDRTPGPRTPGEKLVRAEHSVEIGEDEEATMLLDDLIANENSLRLNAMMIEADRILADDLPVPASMVNDLKIELRQIKNSHLVAPVYAKMAMLEAKRERYFEALSVVNEAKHDSPSDEEYLNAAARQILDMVPADAFEDASYARLVLENRSFLQKDRESEALRQKFAKSLLRRGLPNISLALLEESDALQNTETRMLHAETLLTLNQPQEALEMLGDIDGEPALRLRSQAHLKMGSVDNAYFALADLDDQDQERGKYAVLSRNWSAVEADALSGSLGEFAATMRDSVATAREVTENTPEQFANDPTGSGSVQTQKPSLKFIQSRLSAATELRNTTERLDNELQPR